MFNDKIASNKYEWFVNKFPCKTAIETGMHEGNGTRNLLKHHDTVISCESWDKFFQETLSSFISDDKFNLELEFKTKTHNITVKKLVKDDKTLFLLKGSSELALECIFLNELNYEFTTPYVFYLDAHWNGKGGTDWPILHELETIGNYNLSNSKLIIHDFKVPGFSTKGSPIWGYDENNGFDLDYEYVKEYLFKINNGMLSLFPDNVTNDVNGRGILYCVPPEELDFEEYLSYNRGNPTIELNN